MGVSLSLRKLWFLQSFFQAVEFLFLLSKDWFVPCGNTVISKACRWVIFLGFWDIVFLCVFSFSVSPPFPFFSLFSHLSVVLAPICSSPPLVDYMEDLSKQWTWLSPSEGEGDRITIGEDRRSQKHIIVAKFLTRRFLNVDAVGWTFKPLWCSLTGFQIKNLGDNMLLFIFDNPKDVDRVISNEPWSFDKHLVVVQKYDINVPIQDACFNKASFLVQYMTFRLDTWQRK